MRLPGSPVARHRFRRPLEWVTTAVTIQPPVTLTLSPALSGFRTWTAAFGILRYMALATASAWSRARHISVEPLPLSQPPTAPAFTPAARMASMPGISGAR